MARVAIWLTCSVLHVGFGIRDKQLVFNNLKMSLNRNKYRKKSSQYSAYDMTKKAYNTIFFSVNLN